MQVLLLIPMLILTMSCREVEGPIPQELPIEQTAPTALVPKAVIRIDVLEVDDPEKMAHVKVTYPQGQTIVIRKPIAGGAWEELLGELRERLQEHPGEKKMPVSIRAEAKATWRHTLNAFYQAKQAGFDIVTFP